MYLLPIYTYKRGVKTLKNLTLAFWGCNFTDAKLNNPNYLLMNKSIFKINSVFLMVTLCCLSVITNSQDLKMNNREKKEMRKAEKLKDYYALGILLESKKFSFSTERVQLNSGAKVYNIINIDENRVFVRCEDPINTSGWFSGVIDNSTPRIGPTGLFFEGDIDSWELFKNNHNLSYIVKLKVLTTGSNSGITYEITINVNPNKSAGVEIKSRRGQMIYSNYSGLIRT